MKASHPLHQATEPIKTRFPLARRVKQPIPVALNEKKNAPSETQLDAQVTITPARYQRRGSRARPRGKREWLAAFKLKVMRKRKAAGAKSKNAPAEKEATTHPSKERKVTDSAS
jgi:hypothetical protein